MGDNYVGFANLPNQIHRQAVEKGFEFTLMVVGESGLGKSTLINSLFMCDVFEEHPPGKAGERIPQTLKIEHSTVQIEEGGVRLRLSLIDTPGFGTGIDNDGCWLPLVNEIDRLFEQFMDDESRIQRSNISDQRVHCCLYFIAPTGHRLKALDIEVMKQLQDKVNLVPIIAKSDTLTQEECDQFKERILEDLQQHDISVYAFPEDEEDEGTKDQAIVPFAVSASATTTNVNGVMVSTRQYPWGRVEIENPQHSDFTKLRDLLLRTYMQQLIDSTNDTHYERFRFAKLASMGSGGVSASEINLMVQFEKEKEAREKKMAKMEAEMTQVFAMKVREKEKKLEESEARLLKQHDEMKKEIQSKQKQLEQKRHEFEEEKSSVQQAKELAANPAKLSVRKKTGVRLFHA